MALPRYPRTALPSYQVSLILYQQCNGVWSPDFHCAWLQCGTDHHPVDNVLLYTYSAGMAAHMQDEYELHIGAEHIGRGYGAEGLGLPVRGHFHSSSTQSMTGLAAQQQQLQPQQQHPQGSVPQLFLNQEVSQPTAAQEQQTLQPTASPITEQLVELPQHVQHMAGNDAAAAVTCDQQQPGQLSVAADATVQKVVAAAGASQDVIAPQAPLSADMRPNDSTLPKPTADSTLADALAAAAAASAGQQQLHQLPAHSVKAVQHQAARQLVQQQQPLVSGQPIEDGQQHSSLTLEGNAALPQQQQLWQQQQQQKQPQHSPMILQGVPVQPYEQLGQFFD